MSTIATRPPRQAPKPLPVGAVRWSRTYLDANGVPQKSDTDVPVDDNLYRTEHIRWFCKRGHIDVTIQDGLRERSERRPCDYEVWRLPVEITDIFCPHHGREPLATNDKVKRPMPWAGLLRAARRPGYPLVALGALVAIGSGFHDSAVTAADVAPTVPVAWVGAYWGLRWWQTRDAETAVPPRLDKGQRSGREWRKILRRSRLAGYLAAGSGAWLTAAAAVDPHSMVGTAVWFALPPLWALGAAPWWRYLAELRNHKPEPAPEAVEEAPAKEAADPYPPQARQDADDWATTVATATGLSGTWVDLDSWQADPGGRRMIVRSKGALTDDRLRPALPLIAAAFNVKMETIGWVQEYEGSPRSALLLVQPDSPLNDIVKGDPVDLVPIDDCRVDMGLRMDGGRLVTRLFQYGWGSPSRLILGTKGSGKTELIRRLLYAMLKARIATEGGPKRLVAPFLHDPKRGADFGAFRRLVCGFSVDSDTLHMIVDALGREMERRYDVLGTTVWVDELGREREGERPYDPRVSGPVLSLVADEFHINAKDQALLAKLDPFGRKMRAAGIEINVATHLSTIGDTGSQGFRDMLAGGEAWLLRTTLGLNAALVTGGTLVGDPRALPRVPGMVLQASGEDDTLQARIAYMSTDELYDALYDELNRPLIQPVDWPQETLDAFGHDFVEWMRQCQNRPLGAPQPGVPKGYRLDAPLVLAEDGPSIEALRQILFRADGPITRKAIEKHALWAGRGVTSTLTAALRAGQDATPPWVVKQGAGPASTFELSAWAGEQMSAAAGEAREVAASEQPATDDQMTLL